MTLLFLLACEPPPCPPESERFRPGVEPDEGWSGDLSEEVAYEDTMCSDGVIWFDHNTLDPPMFADCWYRGWCADDYMYPAQRDIFYCVWLKEVQTWKNEHCPDCSLEINDIGDPVHVWVECTP